MRLSRRAILAAAAGVAASPAWAQDGRTEFQDSDGKIRVPVRILGFDVPAVLDSGGSYNVMDARFASDFKVAASGGVKVQTLAGVLKGELTDPMDIQVAGKAISGARFAVLDLSDLSASVGQPVDLILGVPFFQQFVVEIEFITRTLRLSDPAHPAIPPDAPFMQLTPWQGLMNGRLDLPKGPVSATIDTGSDAPVIVSPRIAERQGLLRNGQVSSALIGGIGPSGIGEVASIPALGFGGVPFTDVPLQVTPHNFGGQANVGLDLLSKFTLWLDFANHRMAMKANAASHQFKRNLVGFYATPEGQALRVTHVAENSPAAKAGLSRGDLIVQIDGVDAVQANPQTKPNEGETLSLKLDSGAMISLVQGRYY